ncbi:MAG TPA: glycosyltransferase [Gammaproteobacteria bacterium]|nr:glycosyltransferase [Gammaproteobacteria bacterium]
MRVLLLSRYSRLGASSRVRFLQYLTFMESKGWQIEVSSLFSDDYLRALYHTDSGESSRWSSVIKGYWQRVMCLFQVRDYDLIWIEKELLPFFPAFAEWLLVKVGVKYVVDYDDALFHRYDLHRNALVRFFLKKKIDAVMRYATLVTVGNEYLARRAETAGAFQVELIPTVIDLLRYQPVMSAKKSTLLVGWIGSPATVHYLSMMAAVYVQLAKEFDVRFVAVGVGEEAIGDLPVEVLPWSEETEVQLIQTFDIGIMPLTDSAWERGKCGYKLIQYMACGLPVVASPVGINHQIVEHGVNGFLAHGPDEWEHSLRVLLSDQALRQSMGGAGRTRVEECYSLQVQAPRLESCLRGVLE